MSIDITSFVMGRKIGRDSVKTQEKTVTPGDSEIIVTPDAGFYALSKVTVEAVESAGGGTLPAGVYLTAAEWANPSTYRYKIFKFAGELYATAGRFTSAGFIASIHKLDKATSTWSSLLSSTSSSGLGNATIDTTGWKGAEYNGKFHFLDGKYHAVFDGTRFTASTPTPGGGTISVVVYRGKLYAFEYDTYNLYEWNDGNSSWTTVATLNSTRPDKCVVFKDELYFFSSSTVARYVDGSLEDIMTLNKSYRDIFVVADSLFVTTRDTSKTKLYKVDISTKEIVLLGEIPGFYGVFYSVNTNDISFTAITYGTTSSPVPFFIVNIIEATE